MKLIDSKSLLTTNLCGKLPGRDLCDHDDPQKRRLAIFGFRESNLLELGQITYTTLVSQLPSPLSGQSHAIWS